MVALDCLQPRIGLFRVSSQHPFPCMCSGSNLSSGDDLDGAQLWNGIAKDICMLVKGGDDFKIRVRFGLSGAISADVQISQQGIAVARHL